MHPLMLIAFDIISWGILFLLSPLFYLYSPLYTPVTKAVAVAHPTQGNTAHGIVTFTQTNAGVQVTVQCSGLTPGKHGLHIHEFGNCACDDGMCAGSHFNPTKQPHGGPTSKHRHNGDFGNIDADENGNAHLEFIDTQITLNGRSSIIGRSILIHEKEDDLTSQPSGNSGNRLACGVIGIAQP